MTKKQEQKMIADQQKAAEVYFSKLADLERDKEFRKESRRTAVQIVRNMSLSANQTIQEAEIIYQWLIKVLK